MAFPVPKDVRAVRDFELWLGQDELLRTPLPVADPAVRIDVGEWVKPAVSGGVTKAAKIVVADDLASPALGAKVSWTLYVPGDPFTGQADAIATKQIDVLSGTYQAKTKLYNTGSAFLAPGNLLVAVFDAVNSRGYLDAINPAAATIRQLQAVVGRIVEHAGGQLHYESPGL